MKKYVKRTIKPPEQKLLLTTQDELACSTLTQNSAFQTMFNPTQGTGLTQRVGNEIRATGAQIKGILHNNGSNVIFVRFLLLGCGPSVDPATTTPLFKAATTGAGNDLSQVFGLNAMYAPLNKDLFHVYYDKVHKLGPQADPTSSKQFNIFQKLGGKRIRFNGNATGLDNQDWQLLFAVIPSDAHDDTTTGTTLELSYYGRAWFTDS